MKLFYQLTSKQQDSAIEHCANLVANSTVENGLRLEDDGEEDSAMLRQHINSLMDKMKEQEFDTLEEKLEFLMNDTVFSDTIMELACDMAKNAFYHDNDELVVFLDTLDETSSEDDHCEDCEHEEEDPEPLTAADLMKKWNIN